MTIKIFCGTSANGEDAEAQAMLEYTLRKHHPGNDLEINWMMLSRDPSSPWYSEPLKKAGWNTTGWATPFSAFRWAIPNVCGYEGKAIYMDVDMIALTDIAELDRQPHNGAAMLTKDIQHTCVISFDCAKARDVMPSLIALQTTVGLYRNLRNQVGMIKGAVKSFEGNWNCLDGEDYATLDDPDIKVIHFTKVETQPHLKYALPRLRASGKQHWNRQAKELPHARADVQPLVDRLWAEAQAAGYTVDRYLPAEPFGSYDSVRGGKPARAA